MSTLAQVIVMGRGLTVYRAAEPGWTVVPNRYSGRLIGAGILTGPLVWSLMWRRAR